MPVLAARPLIAIALAAVLARAAGDPAAPKVAWLAANAVAIHSLDPHDQDFEDLRPLRARLGGARMVLLGGSNFGAVVEAKFRLVRFLHQELGFEVLAVPAPFFEGEQIDRSLERGKLPPELMRQRMTSVTTLQPDPRRRQVPWPVSPVDLVKYAYSTRASDHPLHIAGVGNSVPFGNYAKELFQFVDGIDPKLLPSHDRRAIRSMLSALQSGSPIWWNQVPAGMRAIRTLDQKLEKVREDSANQREMIFYRRTLAELASSVSPELGGAMRGRVNSLVWYAKFWKPDAKIVVWSTNAAIGRNMRLGPSSGVRRSGRSTGDAVAQEFGLSAYSIAFTEITDAGNIAQVLVAGPEPHLAPVTDNFESLLHAMGKPFAFIDFRSLPDDHWLMRPLTARFINTAESAIWPQYFDAAVGIDLTTAGDKKRP